MTIVAAVLCGISFILMVIALRMLRTVRCLSKSNAEAGRGFRRAQYLDLSMREAVIAEVTIFVGDQQIDIEGVASGHRGTACHTGPRCAVTRPGLVTLVPAGAESFLVPGG